MTNFIEVTHAQTGEKEIINTSIIVSISRFKDQSVIYFLQTSGKSNWTVSESFDQLKKLLVEQS